jgi:hypothetical protein
VKKADKAKARDFFGKALAGYERNKDQPKVDNCKKMIAELD